MITATPRKLEENCGRQKFRASAMLDIKKCNLADPGQGKQGGRLEGHLTGELKFDLVSCRDRTGDLTRVRVNHYTKETV